MTEKEKARELFDNFENYVDDNDYTYNSSKENSKICATITVNEIIDLINNKLRYYIDYDDSLFYWEEVKKEIEKL